MATFQTILNSDFEEKLLDDLEDADPREQGTVLFNRQLSSQMRRLQRASSRAQNFPRRMWSRSAATWEAKEAFLVAFNLDDMLQERQAARNSRYGDREEDYLGSIEAYGVPDGALPGDLLANDANRVQSASYLSKEAGVSEEAWQDLENQAPANGSQGQHQQGSKDSQPAGSQEDSTTVPVAKLLEAFLSGNRWTPPPDDIRMQIAELHNDDLKNSAQQREELEDLRDTSRLSQMEDELTYDFFAKTGTWLQSLPFGVQDGTLNSSLSTLHPELYLAFLGQARRHLDEMERDMDYKWGTLSDMDLSALGVDLQQVASNLTLSLVTLLFKPECS